MNIKQILSGIPTTKKSYREQKKRYRDIEARKLEAYRMRMMFPKGERTNRQLFLKQIEDKPEFKKDFKMMKDMLRGFL